MLVGQALPLKVQHRRLEFGGKWGQLPLRRLQPSNPCFLKIVSIGDGFESLFGLTHPFGDALANIRLLP